jgi:hypothetical protein
MKTRPNASGPGSGGSTISFAGGSFSIVSNGDGPRMSLAVCAMAATAYRAIAIAITPIVTIAAPEKLRRSLLLLLSKSHIYLPPVGFKTRTP